MALCASVCFASCAVIIRKATAGARESFTATAISVFVGIPFFAVAISIAGDWGELLTVSWQALILLGAAGIIHFVAGRQLSYNALRFIGANKATPFIMTNHFYTVILSVIFLNESLTATLILGVIFIFGGAALITVEKRSVSEGSEGASRTEVKGILVSLAAAVCWGVTPILIKSAAAELASPSARAFISYTVASIVMACLYFRRQQREQMTELMGLPLAANFITVLFGGLLACGGQMLGFTALGISPASMLAPLMSTQILFILVLSFLLNRQIEVFTPKVIMGMVATVAGTIFIFL